MERLEIIYQDEHFLAVNKPSGLLVHRSWLDRHETRFALQLVRDQVGAHVFPAHRLDKPTSGILFFGLSSTAARALSELFAARLVAKTYLAIVRGLTAAQGVIDHPLVESRDKLAPGMGEEKGAQAAVTAYTRLASVELPFPVGRYPTSRYSLVVAHPQSGRRHQIRRHFKSARHPIVGDVNHGEGRHNRFFREHYDCHRLLLAATEITFTHPYSGEKVTVVAPLDRAFSYIVKELGWEKAVPGAWLGAGGGSEGGDARPLLTLDPKPRPG